MKTKIAQTEITTKKLFITSYTKEDMICYARLQLYSQIDKYTFINGIKFFTLFEHNWYDAKKELYIISIKLEYKVVSGNE